MTALPMAGSNAMSLICDGCAATVSDVPTMTRDWEVVWSLISKHGWSGSPFAIGPHRCQHCTSRAAVADVAPGIDPAPVETVSTQPWRVAVHDHGDVAVVDLDGDIDLLVADALRDALTEAAGRCTHVVLNLAGVRLIDSTGLGVLVRAHQQVKRGGGLVCLAAPSRFIIAVLHTMRLHPVFPLFEEWGTAVEWLSGTRVRVTADRA